AEGGPLDIVAGDGAAGNEVDGFEQGSGAVADLDRVSFDESVLVRSAENVSQFDVVGAEPLADDGPGLTPLGARGSARLPAEVVAGVALGLEHHWQIALRPDGGAEAGGGDHAVEQGAANGGVLGNLSGVRVVKVVRSGGARVEEIEIGEA